MDVKQQNTMYSLGKLAEPGVFPHLEALSLVPHVFRVDFGLPRLPAEPGVIVIRGPRQYGKSTWLESALHDSLLQNGPATAYYLNGDELKDERDLLLAIQELLPLFSADRGPHRLFIDEITAVQGWEKALKRLIDEGRLRSVLVVTTGSKATDLRRGIERLPGRKGRLERTTFLFTPISFAEFRKACGGALGAACLPAYLLAGGCPLACAELVAHGRLPEHVPEMVRDWVLGECAASGRPRSSLVAVMQSLTRFGGTPVGQAKLARESGLANNTVAAGYVELLADLMCLGISPACDTARRVVVARKPAKYPFINLLAALAWDTARLRSVAEFEALPPEQQGRWFEWLVAQELWRRAAVRGEDSPEILPFWQGGGHELDFVRRGHVFVEVKRGPTSPVEFSWFPRTIPGGRLLVVNQERFSVGALRGLTLEDFLLDESCDDSGPAP